MSDRCVFLFRFVSLDERCSVVTVIADVNIYICMYVHGRWDDEAVEVWAKRVYWGLDDIVDAFVKDFVPVYKRWYITDDVVRAKRRKSRKNNARRSQDDFELDAFFANAAWGELEGEEGGLGGGEGDRSREADVDGDERQAEPTGVQPR